VNKQNCWIWDDSREIHQLQMHPEKVTGWCGFRSSGIIGPYFFQNEVSVAITVNDERYRSMISNFLWQLLKWIPITYGSNRMTLCATHYMSRWTFCMSDLRTWYLARRRRELATEIVRFNAFRLLPLGLS